LTLSPKLEQLTHTHTHTPIVCIYKHLSVSWPDRKASRSRFQEQKREQNADKVK